MLKEILEKCKALSVQERRSVTDKYCELVFDSKDTDEWTRMLAESLGPPVKPAGQKPTRDDLRLTREYGGIFADQTLFKKEFGNVTITAMFWPWQDGAFTTLKLAALEK